MTSFRALGSYRTIARATTAALAAAALIAGSVLVSSTSAAAASDSDHAATIVVKTNQYREAKGKKALTRSASLDAVAKRWATKLAKHSYSVPGGASDCRCHNPELSSQVKGWQRLGENVGWVSGYGNKSGAALFTGWRNSAGHRANILGSYNSIGVAVVTAKGKSYGVQVFASFTQRATISPISITGKTVVGQKLTASATTSGGTVLYQWNRGGKPISKATAKTYRLVSNDAGHKLTVTVTVHHSGVASKVRTSSKTPRITAR